MTCIYKYNDTAATSSTNTTAPLSQTAATHIVDNVDVSEEDIPCGVSTEYRPYRPLPSVITGKKNIGHKLFENKAVRTITYLIIYSPNLVMCRFHCGKHVRDP